MLGLSLDTGLERILAIGCHADDIEIGCGGTILSSPGRCPACTSRGSCSRQRAFGVRRRDRVRRTSLPRRREADVKVHALHASFLPYVGEAVKEAFESLKDVRPDVIFTHARDDLHQDHRLACELTWNTFRDHLVLEYEIPKYDGDIGQRNVFVPLADDIVDEKLELLHRHFASQADKHWFDDELFRGLLRLRGMESATRYAEAFTCRKLRLALT